MIAMQGQAVLRFAKYCFKGKPGAPESDTCTMTFPGNHIPATTQRALQWNVTRHGLAE